MYVYNGCSCVPVCMLTICSISMSQCVHACMCAWAHRTKIINCVYSGNLKQVQYSMWMSLSTAMKKRRKKQYVPVLHGNWSVESHCILAIQT